jgi:hypothetical protein
VRRGEDVLLSAPMVSDDGARRVWRLRRELWAYETARTLTDLQRDRTKLGFDRALAAVTRRTGQLREELACDGR